MLHIRRGQVYVRGRIVLYDAQDSPLKTDAARRDIPIPQPLLSLLLAHKQAGSLPVIASPRGTGHLPQSTYARKWFRLMASIGLDGITAHNFRHTFATILHAAHVDQKTAQYVLGHEDYYTTAQIYTHIQDRQIEAARTQIDAAFSHL